jgi:hypothetical protein
LLFTTSAGHPLLKYPDFCAFPTSKRHFDFSSRLVSNSFFAIESIKTTQSSVTSPTILTLTILRSLLFSQVSNARAYHQLSCELIAVCLLCDQHDDRDVDSCRVRREKRLLLPCSRQANPCNVLSKDAVISRLLSYSDMTAHHHYYYDARLYPSSLCLHDGRFALRCCSS